MFQCVPTYSSCNYVTNGTRQLQKLIRISAMLHAALCSTCALSFSLNDFQARDFYKNNSYKKTQCIKNKLPVFDTE